MNIECSSKIAKSRRNFYFVVVENKYINTTEPTPVYQCNLK